MSRDKVRCAVLRWVCVRVCGPETVVGSPRGEVGAEQVGVEHPDWLVEERCLWGYWFGPGGGCRDLLQKMVPHGDAAAQDAFNGASVGVHDGGLGLSLFPVSTETRVAVGLFCSPALLQHHWWIEDTLSSSPLLSPWSSPYSGGDCCPSTLWPGISSTPVDCLIVVWWWDPPQSCRLQSW